MGANALKAFYEIEKKNRLPSDSELVQLAKEWGVSHVYVADKTGKFIRNTDLPEDKRTTNLFDFCGDYRKLLSVPGQTQKTPILPSYPYLGSYKFQMMTNWNGSRILEIGYHVSYINKAFSELISRDKKILSIGFLSPTGFNLGSIDSEGQFSHGETNQKEVAGEYWDGDRLVLNTVVGTSVKDCCECRIKKVSNGGGYFYILKTIVSTAELKKATTTFRDSAIGVFLMAAILSFFFSRQLALWVTRDINTLAQTVSDINFDSEKIEKIEFSATTEEVKKLTGEFTTLLKRLELARAKELEHERGKILVRVAEQVAHDICSPLAALAYLEANQDFGANSEIIRSCINRISNISNSLRQKKNQIYDEEKEGAHKTEKSQFVILEPIVESLINEAKLQHEGKVLIDFDLNEEIFSYRVKADLTELSRAISNVFNNSVEAYDVQSNDNRVLITLQKIGNQIVLSIRDFGKGIPKELMEKVFDRNFTSGKQGGSGLGLTFAKNYMSQIGGELSLESSEGQGTKVSFKFNEFEMASWVVNSLSLKGVKQIIIVDDDRSIHEIWKRKLNVVSYTGGISHLYSLKDLEQRSAEFRSSEFLLLIDNEFRNEKITGFEFIKNQGMKDNCILVTSHHNLEAIHAYCRQTHLQLLPKSYLSQLHLTI